MDAIVEGKQFPIPVDLYIPPHALRVFLETTFEGPLDLLLYLIRRQNLDILNINVSEITDQYIAYIELMETYQFELAGEYLVMAAMLAEIKSRTLLPQPEAEDEDEDPRARLIKQLQEYERFKNAAENIDDLPRMGREHFFVYAEKPDINHSQPQPDVALDTLLEAYAAVLKRADLHGHYLITREILSTREAMTNILATLKQHTTLNFQQLFDPAEGRMGVVVVFLALMELVKERLVNLVQAQIMGPIHVSIGHISEAQASEGHFD